MYQFSDHVKMAIGYDRIRFLTDQFPEHVFLLCHEKPDKELCQKDWKQTILPKKQCPILFQPCLQKQQILHLQ